MVLIEPITHGGISAQLIACQNGTNHDCLCLGRTLKVNEGLLALLGLEISLRQKSAQ